MHLAVINASPRVEAKSNTARIIRTFLKGFEKGGNTAEVWHLSDKKQWESAKEAYEKNSNILFAIPLYVENIPGIMLEFLETLQPKKEAGTKMSFILQCGFAEASQLRCGEAYLEILPSYFNCEYNGTLIKGDNFAPAWLPEKQANKMFDMIVEQMKVIEDVTEELKEGNQMEWVQRMGNIEERAMEIITSEIIYT